MKNANERRTFDISLRRPVPIRASAGHPIQQILTTAFYIMIYFTTTNISIMFRPRILSFDDKILAT